MRLKIMAAVTIMVLFLSISSAASAQDYELELREIWRTPEAAEVTHLIVADINNDQAEDMIYSYIENETRQFVCVRDGANQSICWQTELPLGAQHGIQSISAFDVDNDSMLEIVALNDDWKGYVFTGFDGALEHVMNVSESGIVAFGDLDSDGDIEFVVTEMVMHGGIGRERLVVYDGATKAVEWRSPPELLSRVVTQLQICDIDSDGVQEILVETYEERLVVFDGISKDVEFNLTTNSGQLMLVDDLDRDGHKELITACREWPEHEELPRHHLKILNGTTYQIKATTVPMYNYGFLDASLSDMNGDGIADIFVTASSGNGDTIFIFDGSDFSLISQWESGCDVATVAACDIDRDGIADIVLGADQIVGINGTRAGGGHLNIVGTDFRARWASPDIGRIKAVYVTHPEIDSGIIAHGGEAILIYSTHNPDAAEEIPGFGMGAMVVAMFITCAAYRKKRR